MPAVIQGLTLEQWHQRYRQQAAWTETIRQHLFAKARPQPGEPILEVGSGTSAVLEQIQQSNGQHLYGIDINRASLLFSKEKSPDFLLTEADGFELPFPNNCFAISFCHYLLLWIENPVHILKEMLRVTRPGGVVIALAEPDHAARIDYPPPLDELGHLQTESLKQQGVNIKMGRKLGEVFNQAGLSNIEIGILGAQWSVNHAGVSDDTEWMTLRSDLADKLPETDIARYEAIDQQAKQAGSRILFIPTFYALGFAV